MAKNYRSDIVQWVLGILVSFGLLLFLFESMVRQGRDFSLDDLVAIVLNIPIWALGLALFCQLGQTFIRALRYQVMLKVPGNPTPDYSRLLGITFVRNMLVDFLPSRAGELSYVLLLKRVMGERFARGFATLGAAFVFDLVGLLILLGIVGVVTVMAGADVAVLQLAGMLVVLVVFIYVFFFHLLPWLLELTRELRARWLSHKWLKVLNNLADETGVSIVSLKQRGLMMRVLLLSIAVRVFKYSGIVLLLYMVLHSSFMELDLTHVGSLLLGVVAGEAAAGLPLPAFMSFGTYEAGAALMLQGLGYTAYAALISVFIIHLISQVVDYSLGVLSLAVMGTLGWLRTEQHSQRDHAVRTRLWGLLLFLMLLAIGFGAYGYLRFSESRQAAQPSVEEVHHNSLHVTPSTVPSLDVEEVPSVPESDAAEVEKTPDQLRGFAVWTSNRFDGNHELLRYNFEDQSIERLTHTNEKEWYPSISPDGNLVVFSRSHQPGWSFRNFHGWSVHVLNLETGEEQFIADEGYEPTWAGDSETVLYVRAGSEVVRHNVRTGEKHTLLRAGRDGIPSGFQFQTPHYNPHDSSIAVTIRGARRTKMIYPSEVRGAVELPEGCQLFWLPCYEQLVFVNESPQGGTFYLVDRVDGASNFLHRPPNEVAHRYFPRFSPDGKWLIYGASTAGHPHDEGAYDIYLWRLGSLQDSAHRLSFDPGNDAWPDMFLYND